MKSNLKERLAQLEELAVTEKPLIICCDRDADVEKLISEWKTKYGEVPDDQPLIIIKSASRIDNNTIRNKYVT